MSNQFSWWLLDSKSGLIAWNKASHKCAESVTKILYKMRLQKKSSWQLFFYSLKLNWIQRKDDVQRKAEIQSKWQPQFVLCLHMYPDSKVHGAKWGTPGADRAQVGPMLAPWTLVSVYSWPTPAGKLAFARSPMRVKIRPGEWNTGLDEWNFV